jgi:NADPH-dependent 7-cyano-7-deazaguanine reductase QueF
MSLFDDAPGRRAALVSAAAPGPHLDYVVTLSAQVRAAEVTLRYVPDRLILEPGAFAGYAAALAGDWDSPEKLAIAVLDDVNNEVVPRWLQVTVRADRPEGSHAVAATDRQPNWKNPSLMARLGTL